MTDFIKPQSPAMTIQNITSDGFDLSWVSVLDTNIDYTGNARINKYEISASLLDPQTNTINPQDYCAPYIQFTTGGGGAPLDEFTRIQNINGASIKNSSDIFIMMQAVSEITSLPLPNVTITYGDTTKVIVQPTDEWKLTYMKVGDGVKVEGLINGKPEIVQGVIIEKTNVNSFKFNTPLTSFFDTNSTHATITTASKISIKSDRAYIPVHKPVQVILPPATDGLDVARNYIQYCIQEIQIKEQINGNKTARDAYAKAPRSPAVDVNIANLGKEIAKDQLTLNDITKKKNNYKNDLTKLFDSAYVAYIDNYLKPLQPNDFIRNKGKIIEEAKARADADYKQRNALSAEDIKLLHAHPNSIRAIDFLNKKSMLQNQQKIVDLILRKEVAVANPNTTSDTVVKLNNSLDTTTHELKEQADRRSKIDSTLDRKGISDKPTATDAKLDKKPGMTISSLPQLPLLDVISDSVINSPATEDEILYNPAAVKLIPAIKSGQNPLSANAQTTQLMQGDIFNPRETNLIMPLYFLDSQPAYMYTVSNTGRNNGDGTLSNPTEDGYSDFGSQTVLPATPIINAKTPVQEFLKKAETTANTSIITNGVDSMFNLIQAKKSRSLGSTYTGDTISDNQKKTFPTIADPFSNGAIYNQFSFNSIQESYSEKFQLEETMSDGQVLFTFGKKPEIWTFMGTVLNDLYHAWYPKLRLIWKEHLRASMLVLKQQYLVIVIPSAWLVVECYPIGLTFQQNVQTENDVPFVMAVYVKDSRTLPDIASRNNVPNNRLDPMYTMQSMAYTALEMTTKANLYDYYKNNSIARNNVNTAPSAVTGAIAGVTGGK